MGCLSVLLILLTLTGVVIGLTANGVISPQVGGIFLIVSIGCLALSRKLTRTLLKIASPILGLLLLAITFSNGDLRGIGVNLGALLGLVAILGAMYAVFRLFLRGFR